ncbi:MAG: hypothetical protein M0024_09465 [Nitrospiraceae bacterium]|nr:hypothetical protein [Nitrospiraceae bacterium]
MKKFRAIGLLLLGLILVIGLPSFSAAANMTDYCQYPLFLSSIVPPNILFVIDESGSMSWGAYSYGGVAYNATVGYEGYFTPNKLYTLDVNGVYQESAGSTCSCSCSSWKCSSSNSGGCDPKGTHGCRSNRYACCTNQTCTGDCNPQTGNYLNYLNMRRVDLIQWAITGGSPATCGKRTDTSVTGNVTADYCDPELYNKAGNNLSSKVGTVCSDTLPINSTGTVQGGCILKTDSGVKVKVPWSRIHDGMAFQLTSLPAVPRLGAMFYDSTDVRTDKVYIGDYPMTNSMDPTHPFMNLITHVNSHSPSGSTPTAPALWDAYNYYAQNAPQYNGYAIESTTTDQWKDPMYSCDQTGVNCQLIACTNNFVILMSDGQWNEGGSPGSVNAACSIDVGSSLPVPTTLPTSSLTNRSADPVVPAYLMHMGFTNAKTNVKTEVSALYTIGLFLSGTGQQAMKNIAMYGGFDNSARTWPGGVSTSSTNYIGYPSATCTSADCGSSKGSACAATPASSTDWDKNADGIPDTFLKADNALQIKQSIMGTILDILGRASAGTAASILASGEGSGANMIQAVFYPKKVTDPINSTELDWMGTLQNLWYFSDPALVKSSIYEDTTQDMKMVLTNDDMISLKFDSVEKKTKAYRYVTDQYGNAVSSDSTVYLEDVKNLWEAGKTLWATDPANRKIYTTTTGAANSLIDFQPGVPSIRAELQMPATSTSTDQDNVVSYVRGTDFAAYRPRTTALDLNGNHSVSDVGESPKVWKLGDIVSSTPKIVAWLPLNRYDKLYSDASYTSYVQRQAYRSRGTVFAGANDGMLHAFNLGTIDVIDTGTALKAKLCDQSEATYNTAEQKYHCPDTITSKASLGTEQWAFIPKNVLPYLQHLTDPDYCHLYYVDAAPYVIDASVGIPTGCTETTDYWKCAKTSASWRTILIGSMRLGGACKNVASTFGVTTPATNEGFSSYFALDITDAVENPTNLAAHPPVLLWEFSDPGMGFSTAGPAVVRLSWRTVTGTTTTADTANAYNGKWYVVLASGPTGPINTATHQFKGYSDQNLKLFILDLKSGKLLRTIDSGIANAFAGSLINSPSDLDGDYQDDVLYLGYTKSEDAIPSTSTKWTQGGVLRLLTLEDLNGSDPNPGDLNAPANSNGTTGLNPYNWELSRVIDNIGPVTTAIGHGTDIKANGLPSDSTASWLLFGTGRFFFQGDDLTSQRQLFGIKDPCFVSPDNRMKYVNNTRTAYPGQPICRDGVNSATSTEKVTFCSNVYTPCTCGATGTCTNTTATKCGDLYNATAPIDLPSSRVDYGWYINLEGPNNCQATTATCQVANPLTGAISTSECNRTTTAERVLTDPLVTPNGGVFFTTFEPSSDVCQFGGNSYTWALTHDIGSSLMAACDLMAPAGTHICTGSKGKGFLQVSSGEIAAIDFGSAFTSKYAQKGQSLPGKGSYEILGRRTGVPIMGMPPGGQGLSVEMPPSTVDTIMHIRKK